MEASGGSSQRYSENERLDVKLVVLRITAALEA
jgi:hypothetical protein